MWTNKLLAEHSPLKNSEQKLVALNFVWTQFRRILNYLDSSVIFFDAFSLKCTGQMQLPANKNSLWDQKRLGIRRLHKLNIQDIKFSKKLRENPSELGVSEEF